MTKLDRVKTLVKSISELEVKLAEANAELDGLLAGTSRAKAKKAPFAKGDSESGRALLAVMEPGRLYTQKELRDATGLPVGTVGATLFYLRRGGKIVSPNRGLHQLA